MDGGLPFDPPYEVLARSLARVTRPRAGITERRESFVGRSAAFLAIGAFGQYIYVHPSEQVVAVVQSAWRQHDDNAAAVEIFALLRAALLALRPDPVS